MERKKLIKFGIDWAAILALALCFIAFTAIKGSAFMSQSNMVNILRAMAITTVFGIAATITMAPDGFDMSAGTLGSCSAYAFVSSYLWFGQSLFMSVVITIVTTLVLYQLTMFLILVCKIPDMLATCALMFVHQGLGQWYIGGGADLEGKTLGVQTGTTGDILVSDIKGATVERYAKGMDAVQALSQGKIDAVVIDREGAKKFVEETSGLKTLDEAYAEEEYAIAIKKGNTALLDAVNKALSELKADGTVDSIIAKYIKAN